MNKEFITETGQKFITNVLVGTGAVWGSSEVVCLRNNNNKKLWRGISCTFGIYFFTLYLNERIHKYNALKEK